MFPSVRSEKTEPHRWLRDSDKVSPRGKSFDSYNTEAHQGETLFGPNISAPLQRFAIISLWWDTPHYTPASSLLFYCIYIFYIFILGIHLIFPTRFLEHCLSSLPKFSYLQTEDILFLWDAYWFFLLQRIIVWIFYSFNRAFCLLSVRYSQLAQRKRFRSKHY